MITITKHYIGLLTAIAICIFLLFVNPFSVSPQANKVLAIAGLMITLWVTEALPMPVVALLPLVLFPLLGIAKMDETTLPYANPIIFLFMGGFMLGIAIEKWQLHKRIALTIVKFTGTSGNSIVLGFIIATGFLSMWLSNTATTMMMFPIAMSVIHVMETTQTHEPKGIKNLGICLMLSIAYASNLAIGTIIGTPPNAAYVAYLEKTYSYNFSFAEWMYLCTPLSVLLMAALYFVMTKWLYPNNIKKSAVTGKIINNQLSELGKLTTPEKRVIIVFCSTAFLWIVKDIINISQSFLKLDDTIIAILGAITMFVMPSNATEETGGKLLEWSDTKKMGWGTLLLFGGGITLANQLEKAGLISKMGTWISAHSGNNIFVLVLIVTTASIFLSEVLSNVAQVIVFAPVVTGIATAFGINPILLGLPMTLAASCAGMLPMGTPPNAIVFGSGKLKLGDMIKTGFIMNIICIILITLFCYFLVPLAIQPIAVK
ncbi:MAG: DASS family sodium-coupled anion symporter, partial [Deinococcales bacterium]|nr:DASS family sodium-coupled anion symporter [Chitinophagaceae bacterium]